MRSLFCVASLLLLSLSCDIPAHSQDFSGYPSGLHPYSVKVIPGGYSGLGCGGALATHGGCIQTIASCLKHESTANPHTVWVNCGWDTWSRPSLVLEDPTFSGAMKPLCQTAEPTNSRAHMPQEKPRHCKAHAPQRRAALHSPQLPMCSNKDPAQPKIIHV